MTDTSQARPISPSDRKVKRVSVVLNPNGGSVPADGREILERLLSDMGIESRFQMVDQDCEAACQRARAGDCDAIIVWGGDGTTACALNSLAPEDPAILPLPGGTMNMLHKFVHGDDLDPGSCLQAVLADPVEMEIAAGEVSGHRFYVGALLGGLTRLAGPREALAQIGLCSGAAAEFGEADAFSLDTPMRYHSDAGGQHDAQALGIFLSEDPGRPGFDVLATAPEGLLDLAYTGADRLCSLTGATPGVSSATSRPSLTSRRWNLPELRPHLMANLLRCRAMSDSPWSGRQPEC